MIIYTVTNRVNGKIYVGQMIHTLYERWQQHVCRALSGETRMRLAYAIRKYGPDSFLMEELARSKSREELNQLED